VLIECILIIAIAFHVKNFVFIVQTIILVSLVNLDIMSNLDYVCLVKWRIVQRVLIIPFVKLVCHYIPSILKWMVVLLVQKIVNYVITYINAHNASIIITCLQVYVYHVQIIAKFALKILLSLVKNVYKVFMFHLFFLFYVSHVQFFATIVIVCQIVLHVLLVSIL
jgi:hypothetical protein